MDSSQEALLQSLVKEINFIRSIPLHVQKEQKQTWLEWKNDIPLDTRKAVIGAFKNSGVQVKWYSKNGLIIVF